MANSDLAYTDLPNEKFCTKDPDHDAECFVQLIERKISFFVSEILGNACELATYTFRKSTSLLQGPTAEWYEINITNGTTSDNVRANFITRFAEGRNNFRFRMEVEGCIRGDGEEIQNFANRTKREVDKGWHNDMNGMEAA